MSSSLKFYNAMGSPVSRACLMLIRKLNLDVEVKMVNLAAGEQNSPEFLKLNPMHQVPVLVDGDFVLTESRAILAYLVNKFEPGSSLYPADVQARARVDQRLYYDATVVFESSAQIIRLVLYKGIKKIPEENREKLASTLNILDGFLADSMWLAGNNITIADYAVLGTITTVKIGYFNYFQALVIQDLFLEFGYDLGKHPKLNEWYKRCETLPGFQENVDGAKYLAERMFKVLDDKF